MTTSTVFQTSQNFYLVGIKGVGMVTLAQCLIDIGKKVTGWDVNQEFVTQPTLDQLAIRVDTSTTANLPEETEVVIYTVAHQGKNHPLVLAAIKRHLPVYSHAQALAWFFNQKSGVAICGVGGKTTVSAMIVWAAIQAKLNLSFSVGVGEIIGLKRTGAFSSDSKFFVAEADEYAANPDEVLAGKDLIPRFAYLQPQVIVCPNLKFDHPDVYRNLEHTKEIFFSFFLRLQPNGTLIYNQDDPNLVELQTKLQALRPDVKFIAFGYSPKAQFQLLNPRVDLGFNQAELKIGQEIFALKLAIPGKYNLMNAAAAAAALITLGLSPQQSFKNLATFRSTGRRCQLIKQDQEVVYYDDYAHHPSEIMAVLTSLKEWYPKKSLVAIFQPHTTSRTKALIDQFAKCFDQADQLILLPIFTSAREKIDEHFSSQDLGRAIKQHNQQIKLSLIENLPAAAELLKQLTGPRVVITMGAGDIYQVHELIK